MAADRKPDKLRLADIAAVDAVKSKLRDPGSAQFRNFRRVPMFADSEADTAIGESYVYCGEINSKNAFGGYVGFTRLAVLPWASKKPDDPYGVPGEQLSVYILNADDLFGPIAVNPFCGEPGSEKTGTPIKA
ncbi:hypothetical protein [Blastomonas sp.]|uniref:hypothetical protein n=1 Tax=Blastomonas sp. TaxID=1909299 RepID=UPI0026049D95|nr:hypothetical protein [Blastomonas sp.]MDM7956027.1 hypothetical protein [Blastomonas sp.]